MSLKCHIVGNHSDEDNYGDHIYHGGGAECLLDKTTIVLVK